MKLTCLPVREDPIFPAAIKHIRLSLELNTKEFGELLGISRSAVYRYESPDQPGHRPPAPETWAIINAKLNEIKYFENQSRFDVNTPAWKKIQLWPGLLRPSSANKTKWRNIENG